jgi:hypothetical protein
MVILKIQKLVCFTIAVMFILLPEVMRCIGGLACSQLKKTAHNLLYTHGIMVHLLAIIIYILHFEDVGSGSFSNVLDRDKPGR